jgi:CHAT domain-containing protein
MLAGAARTLTTDSAITDDDGILTAEEVAGLDLRGVRCVVLSACETGMGVAEDGEGLYGLRRAFLGAGAGSMVSSLWPVSDRTTIRFMQALYASSEQPLPTSLRQAALEALDELNERGQPNHPFYWGGFISIGNWQSLRAED